MLKFSEHTYFLFMSKKLDLTKIFVFKSDNEKNATTVLNQTFTKKDTEMVNENTLCLNFRWESLKSSAIPLGWEKRLLPNSTQNQLFCCI